MSKPLPQKNVVDPKQHKALINQMAKQCINCHKGTAADTAKIIEESDVARRGIGNKKMYKKLLNQDSGVTSNKD